MKPRNIRLSGNPRPSPRPRVTKRGTFYPSWYDTQSEAWALEAGAQTGDLIPRPVRMGVELHFYCETWGRADFDNLAKAATDPLSGVVYQDDDYIDEAHIYVHRGVGKGNGGVVVTVKRVGRVQRSPGLRTQLQAAHVRALAQACRKRAAVTLPQRARVQRREAA